MVITLCDSLIASDILPNCQEQNAGFEAVGYIVNRADIDFGALTYNTTNSNVISNFPMKDGKKAFRVQQLAKGAFDETTTTLNAGTYRNVFNNEVHVRAFATGPSTAKQILQLANGEVVLILEQKQKNLKGFSIAAGESAYRVYGLQNGLRMTECTNTPNSDDLGNGWDITLTEENVIEPAIFLFDTDYATTAELVESLL